MGLIMGKSKALSTYYSSDFHFGHDSEWTDSEGEKHNRGIITFERTQFETITEHDRYLIRLIMDWSERWAAGSTFWFLGDWGDLSNLWTMQLLRNNGIITKMILGNHDSVSDVPNFEKYFDEVYLYPVFTSQKLVLSHYPVAVYDDTINVCGHLHNSKLKDINHVVASIHVANYQPISEKNLATVFSKLPKFTRRFLYEPWADQYQFTGPKEDVVMDRNGNIDLSASRVLQRINKEKRDINDPYQPYVG
jgi:calcineurin-like phosphoesterase family protein